ncbi:MAG: ThiF family adenylyltransferase [Pseudomonadota bacterium]
MLPWWKGLPERLDFELAELDKRGIRHEIDEEARAQGKIVLDIWPVVDGNDVPLRIKFPDSYPYFRFEAEAHALSLSHHQNPVGKNLCLLGRSTDNWNPSDTVASIISSRLKKVIESGSTEDRAAMADLEEHQAEPLSEFCEYQNDAMLLVDSSWDIPLEMEGGRLEVGLAPGSTTKRSLRGAVHSVQDFKRNVVANSPSKWKQLFPDVIKGNWLRINGPLPCFDALGLKAYLESELSSKARFSLQGITGGKVSITGIVFSEEVRYGEPDEDSWVFLLHGHKGAFFKKNKDGSPSNAFAYLARAGRFGVKDYFTRIPELAPLRKKTIAIIGLGCIGSPSAIEFAKAGVGGLRLLDQDIVTPGNTCRWPLGTPSFGLHKSNVLIGFLNSHFPHTNTAGVGFRIGNPNLAGQEAGLISELLDGVDLVYDASAEPGVQQFLADLCRERGIPLVVIESRHGGWGGLVARIRPFAGTGCYLCLKNAQDDGSLPHPPTLGDETFIQPAGCAEPTFTAAGFDTSEVSLAGVRMAVSTLCEGESGGYPPMDHDVGILHLRNENGNLISPRWDYFPLKIHTECACQKSQG